MSARTELSLIVLVVDEEGASERGVALERERPQFDVHTTSDTSAGLSTLDERDVDCVVSGYPPTTRRGADFLAAVREHETTCPVFLLTDGDAEAEADGGAAGITDYVPRTADPVVLATRIANAVARCRAARELAAARERYDLVSRASAEWARVESVAKTPSDHTLVDGILVNTRNVTDHKARKERLRKPEQAIDQTGAAVYMKSHPSGGSRGRRWAGAPGERALRGVACYY